MLLTGCYGGVEEHGDYHRLHSAMAKWMICEWFELQMQPHGVHLNYFEYHMKGKWNVWCGSQSNPEPETDGCDCDINEVGTDFVEHKWLIKRAEIDSLLIVPQSDLMRLETGMIREVVHHVWNEKSMSSHQLEGLSKIIVFFCLVNER